MRFGSLCYWLRQAKTWLSSLTFGDWLNIVGIIIAILEIIISIWSNC